MQSDGATASRGGAPGRRSDTGSWMLAAAVYLALTVYLFRPLLGCLAVCYVDLAAVRPGLGGFELNDTRLNTWILGWVQHALLTRPQDLFQANALYPAPDMLTGSEHLLGLAVLTLPLRLFTSNAILIHQLTLLLTSWLIALTTFALVRWLTGLVWVSLLAGAFALLMPWRIAELTHIQLLGAHWFPLVWLLALRILLGPERRFDAIGLAVVLALQLLTSYYLAYQLALSLALLVTVVALCGRLRGRALLRLVLASAMPIALLLLASLPYLARSGEGGLPSQARFLSVAGLDNMTRVIRFLAPRLPGFRETHYEYWLPSTLVLLAGGSAVLALGRRRWAEALGEHGRVSVLFLGSCVLASFVMMLGPAMALGDVTISLPSGWAARWIPGYENVRAPSRWGITIGIAMPVLAAIGLRGLYTLVAPWPARRRMALAGATALLLLVDLPWHRPLPAKPAWPDPQRVENLYAALRRLPYGPVLELPWPDDPVSSIPHDTQYQLASTQHWRPILNGFTAYHPPSYDFLRRLAMRLPRAHVFEKLERLTGLRWVVMHRDGATPAQLEAWRQAEARGLVRRVAGDDRTTIYEIPPRPGAGAWLPGLVSPDADRTLSGLDRSPLELPDEAGTLELLAAPRLRFRGVTPVPSTLHLRVSNRSEVAWPSFDPSREGLVELRAVFSDADERMRWVDTAPLDTDVPAGLRIEAFPRIRPPVERGRYRLCLDLVQSLAGEKRALPVAPVEIAVHVEGVASKHEGWAAHLAAATLQREPLPEADVSRCAHSRAAAAVPAAPH